MESLQVQHLPYRRLTAAEAVISDSQLQLLLRLLLQRLLLNSSLQAAEVATEIPEMVMGIPFQAAVVSDTVLVVRCSQYRLRQAADMTTNAALRHN
jgi:hypothetical protein